MSGNNFTLHTCDTNQVIAQLKDLHMLERKVMTALKDSEHTIRQKYIRKSHDLAGRLDTVDFGPRNTALDETKLKEFVQNADTFQWFNERFPQSAESMQRGLVDRTRPRLQVEEEDVKESIRKLWLQVKEEEVKESIRKLRLGLEEVASEFRNEMSEFWNELEKEWNDREKEWNDLDKEWNDMMRKRLEWNDMMRKCSNPTVANEKSNKKPKNEASETELELEFDFKKEWGGVTGGKEHSNSTVANTDICRVQ
ncbi:hypothetical protein HK104_007577 [Borealophlyctis nickersoniae]|nr:hypothetical protein HK104_007577 [Borealophlyctis nickersoniae]